MSVDSAPFKLRARDAERRYLGCACGWASIAHMASDIPRRGSRRGRAARRRPARYCGGGARRRGLGMRVGGLEGIKHRQVRHLERPERGWRPARDEEVVGRTRNQPFQADEARGCLSTRSIGSGPPAEMQERSLSAWMLLSSWHGNARHPVLPIVFRSKTLGSPPTNAGERIWGEGGASLDSGCHPQKRRAIKKRN